MKIFGLLFLTFACATFVFAQKTKVVSKTKKAAVVPSHQRELENAVAKSMRARSLRITTDFIIQGKKVFSRFEYSSPDRFSLFETVDGKVNKEAVEIARQRYQKKDARWIKTRKDYYPLRDQYDSNFPIKLRSKPSDYVKVKSAKVLLSGEEIIDGKKYLKYSYTASYVDFAGFDSAGFAWINVDSGLLERLETRERSLFGPVSAVWNYFYDQEIKIEKPNDFIERDWVD